MTWWRWVPTVPLLLLQRVEDVVVLVELAERRRRKRRRRLLPLLLRQGAVLLQQHIGGAHNARQRCADVVRHGAQQVGVHLFPLRIPADLLLSLIHI